MAEKQVTTQAEEGKELEVSPSGSKWANRSFESATAKLSFLSKVLRPKDEDDDADISLTWYERKGLADFLEDVYGDLQSVWSDVLAPVSKYISEPDKTA